MKWITVILLAALCVLGPALAYAAGAGKSAEPEEEKRISRLMESMRDPDPMVRQWAARKLGESGESRALPVLMDVMAADQVEGVRLSCMGALLIIDDRAALPAYTRALKDESETVRRSAASALYSFWDEPAHAALIEALNTDPSPKVRKNAAEALGNPGVMGKYKAHAWDKGNDTETALIRAMQKDESYEVRAAAAGAVGNYKSVRSIEPLIKALTKDESAAVRASAAQSLGVLEMPQAITPLIDALYFEKDETVLVNALQALKYSDDPRLADTVIQTLGTSSPRVKWQAIDVLEELRPQGAVEPLKEIAGDDYEPDGIRYKAKEALQLMGY